MITEKKLRDLFEEWTGFHLSVHHGEIEQSYRVLNDIVEPLNGVIEVSSWNYTPVRTVAMATASATVTIIARTDEEANEIKDHLNNSLAEIRGASVVVKDDAEKSVLLTVMAGTAYRPEAVHGSLYGRGEEFDVIVRMEYIATANGVSSADTVLIIDGEQVELESITSSMICATDEQPGDDGLTVSAAPSKAFQISAQAVVLDNAVGDLLIREGTSLSDEKMARCVEYRINNKPAFYMMVFTQCQIASSEINNVGAAFSLSTANPDAVPFDSRWSKTVVIGDITSIGANPGAVVFWGDNKADMIGDTGMVSHVYTDGVNEHTIRIFGEYSIPITRQLRLGDNLLGKRLKYMGEDWDVSGLPDSTLITCEQSTLSISSGYMRELRDDLERLYTISDHVLKGQEWVSSLDVVTGARDFTMWHVYTSEMGV